MTNVIASDSSEPVTRPLAGHSLDSDPASIIAAPISGHDDEELARELTPEGPPGRITSILTRTLLVLALLSVGMVGGVLLDRHFDSGGRSGTSRFGGTSGTLQGGFGGGTGNFSGPGGGTGGGAPPTGGGNGP